VSVVSSEIPIAGKQQWEQQLALGKFQISILQGSF